MTRKTEWEFRSLEWLHRIREEHYRKTKGLPLKSWLEPVDPEKAAHACRRMGLKVRVRTIKSRKAG
ncbi:MAG: hypothetical protein HY695_24105 [Deltaproteobacteria bacterium]|nr:hypothetical protein [Deltaproteobacteria bacterium]